MPGKDGRGAAPEGAGARPGIGAAAKEGRAAAPLACPGAGGLAKDGRSPAGAIARPGAAAKG